MVSVGNNLALCSGVIDLRSVVEGVRVADRHFPAAQPVAEAPSQRGGRRVRSSAQPAPWKCGCWRELPGEDQGSAARSSTCSTSLAQALSLRARLQLQR